MRGVGVCVYVSVCMSMCTIVYIACMVQLDTIGGVMHELQGRCVV